MIMNELIEPVTVFVFFSAVNGVRESARLVSDATCISAYRMDFNEEGSQKTYVPFLYQSRRVFHRYSRPYHSELSNAMSGF